MAWTTSTLQLPDGWYWLTDNVWLRQHWFGHVSGARLVLDGSPDLACETAIVHRGDTPESRQVAARVVTILSLAGYLPVQYTDSLFICLWLVDGPPPWVDADRNPPPFACRSGSGAMLPILPTG
ncbi:MAG TPA: hypothetical protein VGK74_23375 [Symbiobacteriaceae bacterium]